MSRLRCFGSVVVAVAVAAVVVVAAAVAGTRKRLLVSLRQFALVEVAFVIPDTAFAWSVELDWEARDSGA